MSVTDIHIKTCPACDARLTPGLTICAKCRMPVAKMADLWAARRKAESLGRGKVKVSEAREIDWRSLAKAGGIAAGVLVVMLGMYFGVKYMGGAYDKPWLRYPTDPEQLVKEFMGYIETDKDKSFDKAYGLMSMSVRHDQESGERGRYRQLYHEVYKYLTEEFGPGWGATMSLVAEPGGGGGTLFYRVEVGAETLHVAVEPQGPEKGPAPSPARYGVMQIAEFPIEEAAEAQQMAGIGGVVGGIAGQAAKDNLQNVIGGLSSRRLTPMQTKRQYLPLVRKANVPRMVVLHLWPVRNDPVVRARLESMVKDQRYAPDVQKTAQEILNGTVPLEDLIAGHVPE